MNNATNFWMEGIPRKLQLVLANKKNCPTLEPPSINFGTHCVDCGVPLVNPLLDPCDWIELNQSLNRSKRDRGVSRGVEHLLNPLDYNQVLLIFSSLSHYFDNVGWGGGDGHFLKRLEGNVHLMPPPEYACGWRSYRAREESTGQGGADGWCWTAVDGTRGRELHAGIRSSGFTAALHLTERSPSLPHAGDSSY